MGIAQTAFSYVTLVPKTLWFLGANAFAKKKLSEEEKKKVLQNDPKIENVVKNIKANKYKNIIVLCGAGISTSAGIKDFRSSRGFYANVSKYELDSPMDIFSLKFFKKNPEPFYKLCKDIIPKEGTYKPTYTHKFINFLHEKNLLLRCWTQNVDSLERDAGLPGDKLVEAHGHVRSCHCIGCKKMFEIDWFKSKILKDEKPICTICKSYVKPDVTFFGEALPPRFFHLFMSDFLKCDLLLVIGTSLNVYPFAGLVSRVRINVPRVLINMEAVGPFRIHMKNNYRDVSFLGDCDTKIKELMEMCEWKMKENENEKKEGEKEKEKEKEIQKVEIKEEKKSKEIINDDDDLEEEGEGDKNE